MTILKSISNTFLFILLANVISCWILLLPHEMDIDVILTLDSFFTSYVFLILVAIYLGFINDSTFLSVSKTSGKYYFYAFLLGFSFVFVQTPLNLIYNEIIGTAYNIHYEFQPIDVLKYSNSYAAILIAPVCEEFFFRKFIQSNLQKSYHPSFAILLAAILFATIHLPFSALFYDGNSFSFHHAYITLFGGIILGSLFYKSKSTGPAIIMHLFWNLGVYIF